MDMDVEFFPYVKLFITKNNLQCVCRTEQCCVKPKL